MDSQAQGSPRPAGREGL